MVPAHLPETVHTHAQSDMKVICKRGLSWKRKGDPFLERKHRNSVKRKGNQENLWKTKDEEVRLGTRRARKEREADDERVFSACPPLGLERGGTAWRVCVT